MLAELERYDKVCVYELRICWRLKVCVYQYLFFQFVHSLVDTKL
jgi:hypothetical protein